MGKDHRKTIIAEGYDAIGEAYLAWGSRVLDDPRDRMLAEFSARMPSGARVLDLGCGAGLPTTKALASRFDVTGVDISEAQVEAARRYVPEASFIPRSMPSPMCRATSMALCSNASLDGSFRADSFSRPWERTTAPTGSATG